MTLCLLNWRSSIYLDDKGRALDPFRESYSAFPLPPPPVMEVLAQTQWDDHLPI